MEELLKQIITRLDRMDEGQQYLKAEIAAIKETMATKAEIAAIKETMATKTDIAQLESKLEVYGQVQQNDVYHLLKLTGEKIDGIRDDLKSLVAITGEHEVRIRTLFRRPV